MKHEEIVWAKVEPEAEPALASALQIRAIPTLAIFRDGILVFSQAGIFSPHMLEQAIEKTRALDMAAIRKEVDAAEKEKAKATAAREIRPSE